MRKSEKLLTCMEREGTVLLLHQGHSVFRLESSGVHPAMISSSNSTPPHCLKVIGKVQIVQHIIFQVLRYHRVQKDKVLVHRSPSSHDLLVKQHTTTLSKGHRVQIGQHIIIQVLRNHRVQKGKF